MPIEIYTFWISTAFLFFLTELLLPGSFAFLFLGGAALMTALYCVTLSSTWFSSILVFSLSSILLIGLTWRRYESHWKIKKNDNPNQSIKMLLGRSGSVIFKDKSNLRVKIDSHIWSATLDKNSHDVDIGSSIWVVGVDRLTLIVSSHRKNMQSSENAL